MKIIVYNNNNMETNCYVLETENVSIVIDPCYSYINLPKKIKEKLKAVFITHGHFDHFTELDSYKNKGLKFYMHLKCFEKLANSLKNCSSLGYGSLEVDISKEDVTFVNNNMMIDLDEINVLCMETFGHSNCSVSYLVDEDLFCGDFIFKDSIGRCDLITGNSNEMKASLEKIKKIPLNYTIYPGHGEATTLDNEKENNYYFK